MGTEEEGERTVRERERESRSRSFMIASMNRNGSRRYRQRQQQQFDRIEQKRMAAKRKRETLAETVKGKRRLAISPSIRAHLHLACS